MNANRLISFVMSLALAAPLFSQQTVNVTVNANSTGWTATGVTKGENTEILICATGLATIWPTSTTECWRYATPSGLGGNNVCTQCECSSCPRIALIGRFGSGTLANIFFVGDRAYISSSDPGSGELFLRINDDPGQVGDNSGSFDVSISTSCEGVKECFSNGTETAPDTVSGTHKRLIPTKPVLVHPNPASDEINVDVDLNVESSILIEILDMSGKVISKIAQGNFDAGVYHFTHTPEAAANNSIVFIRSIINNKASVEKVILVK